MNPVEAQLLTILRASPKYWRELLPDIPCSHFGTQGRVTTDRKNRAYVIWSGSVPAHPHLFNEKLMKIGRLMGAKDFTIARVRK